MVDFWYQNYIKKYKVIKLKKRKMLIKLKFLPSKANL